MAYRERIARTLSGDPERTALRCADALCGWWRATLRRGRLPIAK